MKLCFDFRNIFFLALELLIINSSLLISEIRYVSKTGSSTPPYTSWATASDSIQKCINISNFGDTIYVANGVYKERIDMKPGLNLIGAGMDSCVINSVGVLYPVGTYSVKVTDRCYLAGFQIISYTNSTQGIGVYIYDPNNEMINTIVEKNKITNTETGFRISSSSLGVDTTYKLISKNLITNVAGGIWIAQTNPIVVDNIIYPKDFGLGSSIISSPTYINNTVIMDHGGNTASGYSGGFHIRSLLMNNSFFIYQGEKGIYSINDSIINNVITGNPTYGIWTQAGGIVKNNIVKGAAVGLRQISGITAIVYNDLWENNNNFLNINPDSTNQYNDPMFVNEDSLDLHLQMYSPLIDAGDPTILDKDGSRSDIGLFGGPYGERYKYLDLAPRAPVNLTAVIDTNEIRLSWSKNTEADTFYYNVYRDTVPNFTIDSTRLVGTVTDTFFIQSIPHSVGKYIYKVTCVDNQSNESTPSEEIIVLTSIKEFPTTINDYMLYQNYPNPFNPSTKIGYRLKESGYVKLYVYDIKGELLSALVNQTQEAGYYEVEFNASSGSGQSTSVNQLTSGIYIYQIMVRNENNIPVFSDLKKMIYLK